jgi:hypothetical protein
MPQYAANTDVSCDQSRSEIERTLRRYNATGFGYGWDESKAMIEFTKDNRRVRFILPLPDKNDPKFGQTPTGRTRKNEDARLREWEQSCRQLWRALGLCIKAKLEAVEANISTFDSEFLSFIVLPGNKTVGETFLPQLEEIYATRKVPKLLMAPEH